MRNDPVPLLLESYDKYGPVFTLRVLYLSVAWMIGPAANHYMLVSHADNFEWRTGVFGDLIPLLGDGMLTIDGDYHRKARKIMLPAFHREQLAATVDTMSEEASAAIAALHDGERVDLYQWSRTLALRIAMRALLGFDPDSRTAKIDPAREFERALNFYARDYSLQNMRGPFTPWAQMQAARRRLDKLIYELIAQRRSSRSKHGTDVLTLLLQARDENGDELSDRELRDQVMTLLFAGHDTTTSTLTFLFYELSRNSPVATRLREESERVLGGRLPTAPQLFGELPYLDMVLDETLRLYPPAWIGPRRCIKTYEFEGVTVPKGTPVNYCSWASHRLPEVFPNPDSFIPERFTSEAKAKLPKGAYVPFGGGSRTCIGMRFGQMEIKLIASMLLQSCSLELDPAYMLSIRQMPTLSPRNGMPMQVARTRRSRPLAA